MRPKYPTLAMAGAVLWVIYGAVLIGLTFAEHRLSNRHPDTLGESKNIVRVGVGAGLLTFGLLTLTGVMPDASGGSVVPPLLLSVFAFAFFSEALHSSRVAERGTDAGVILGFVGLFALVLPVIFVTTGAASYRRWQRARHRYSSR